jgi:hypothetical protein
VDQSGSNLIPTDPFPAEDDQEHNLLDVVGGGIFSLMGFAGLLG